MTTYRHARVESTESWGPGAQLLEIVFEDGSGGKGLSFESLIGDVNPGDEVIANTTAVELGLGTGGYHFVLWNLARRELDTGADGHIMKLRYTPLQMNVGAVEEKLPDLDVRALGSALEGMPVVAGSLHSQLLPVAVAFKHVRPAGRLVYIMTDGGSLPAAFSHAARFVRERRMVESVITCGHTFGGDLEAVGIYGALIGARMVCEADAVVVLMGPGIVGTGSAFGFSGMEQAAVINAAGSLGGASIAIPRISFADSRERHHGLSHHTVSALKIGACARTLVPIPIMQPDRRDVIFRQLDEAGILEIHEVREVDAGMVPGLLDECGMEASVMGRSLAEEPEYFMAAGAAGLLAAGTGGE